jgi:hypothetical protein
MAMGDTCAVELAQTAHIGILRQMGLLREENLLAMNLPVPRGPSMIGIVIDDLITLEKIVKGAVFAEKSVSSESGRVVQEAVKRFKDLGLIPHEGKTFYQENVAEFWGALIEGDRGFVRASLKRTIPILFATVGVLKLGVCTISLLEVLVGSWTSIFLFRRRLLSVLNVVYEAMQRCESRAEVIRLSAELTEELLLCVSLGPLAATFLRTKDCAEIFASDASSQGWAVVKAQLPPFLSSEVHRHSLKKHVWTRLLSPVKVLEKIRGVLAEEDELPDGVPFQTHPLWLELSRSLQFQTVKARLTPQGRHINIDELQGMLEAEKCAAGLEFPLRFFSLADSQVSLGALLKGRSSSLGLNSLLQQSLPLYLGCGLVANYGFLPSKFNPADDPTRQVPIRSPDKSLPFWMDPNFEMQLEERLAYLDSWLESEAASPWDLSGLPLLSELDGEFVEDPNWDRTKRQKTFLKQKRSRRCHSPVSDSLALGSEVCLGFPESVFSAERPEMSAEAELQCKTFCEPVSEDLKESNIDRDPAAFERSLFCTVSSPDTISAAPTEVLTWSFPTAKSLGVPPLSVRAREKLKEVPRDQLLFPNEWKVPEGWLPDFAGYLDLYSGQKGVAKAVTRSKRCWAITFELEDSFSQDLSIPENRSLVAELISLNAVHTVGAAIFCRSFSRAVRPPVRSKDKPAGLPDVSLKMQTKVFEGNEHAEWLASIIQLCRKHAVKYWVENPDLSFLWLLPIYIALGSLEKDCCFRLDYCTCNTPWRKRTRFLTDLHLKGQTFFCRGGHKHLRLVGWSRMHKKAWTRVAQVYPRRLANWMAAAILIDSGLLPGRRKLDLALVARQSNSRIGEASNPGPRRPTRHRRPLQQLLDADLVEPQTAVLGERVWLSFKTWCLKSLTPDAFDALSTCAPTLCLMVESFGKYLFEEGHSLYLLRQLITYVQRWRPQFRGSLGGAWQLVSKWEQIQPLRHRTPLPLVVYRAMVSIGLMWRWYRWTAVTMLAFEGICRPGEPLSAIRKDLLLARDLLVEDPDVVFLRIQNPKGRRRGIGAVQHTKVVDKQLAVFLDAIYGRLDLRTPLFPGSASSYRKRWDEVIAFLKIPKSLQLTPASLRAGGAVRAYRADEELAKLMWRMRLKSIDTLQHYLQEVGAASIFVELPTDSRSRIHNAALLFDVLMDSFQSLS